MVINTTVWEKNINVNTVLYLVHAPMIFENFANCGMCSLPPQLASIRFHADNLFYL